MKLRVIYTHKQGWERERERERERGDPGKAN
jgi:hypothetical protein